MIVSKGAHFEGMLAIVGIPLPRIQTLTIVSVHQTRSGRSLTSQVGLLRDLLIALSSPEWRGSQLPEEPPPLTTRLTGVLFFLGPWKPIPLKELDRDGFGYKPAMSMEDLYKTVRGIWTLSPETARNYTYAVGVFQRLTRGVWRIDHKSWQEVDIHTPTKRWAFRGHPITEGVVWEAFIGPRGHIVPETIPSGIRRVSGTGAAFGYWPN